VEGRKGITLSGVSRGLERPVFPFYGEGNRKSIEGRQGRNRREEGRLILK
jgi:hypothetical protein